ncbi:MAG: 30S ribosomal protein S17e [Candidatus Aramenus sulfurataquae]|jgi:small subunit ribosomal protein S17e|uniref:Small ribosomal subunit protein eS17 n=2 Tax=Candidatus Aramenus sulfurataquae TaxID=1326980 RepID=A0A0F2LTB9_9CREN|nr:30S ribosomal protein S17e [Candidatus Aramenus sulfurataquae]
MGNIYTRDIKRVAEELYEKYKDEVTEDFGKNKELVSRYLEVYSKKVRNRIAGYLTRYAKKSKRAVTSREVEEEVGEE